MYGPESCIPVRVSRSDDPDTLAGLGQRLAAEAGCDFLVHVRLEPGAGPLSPLYALFDSLQGTTVVLDAAPPALVEVLAGAKAPHLVTVRLTGSEQLHELGALIALAHQEVRVVDATTSDLTAADALESLGFFRVFTPGGEDDPYRLRADVFVDGTGQLRAGDSFHSASVVDAGVEGASRALGHTMDAFRLASPFMIPMAFRVPEPDGSGTVRYWCGGSQAFGAYLEAEESRAALGFRSNEIAEFGEFLGEDVEAAAQGLFPAFDWGWPDFAPAPRGPLPPRQAKSERCTFAAALARSRADRVGFALGLLNELPGAEPKANLAYLDDGRLRAALDRVDARWCAALELLAQSRATDEARQRAITALEVASTSEARRALTRLQKNGVTRAGTALARWKTSHSRKKREKRSNSDPQARLKWLQESLEVCVGVRRAP